MGLFDILVALLIAALVIHVLGLLIPVTPQNPNARTIVWVLVLLILVFWAFGGITGYGPHWGPRRW